MDSHALAWPLELHDGLPGFCLTTVECPMQGRIPADEEAWLYHESKMEVDMYSLLQATLPPGPVEDEVTLGLAGRVSELSIEQKRGYVCGFPHFA